MDGKIIADLLLPNIKNTPDYYEGLYPERNLPEGAVVTRFAPSPTGFLHLGGLYISIVYERLAHQSGGVFCLRIEDTDRKREVKGGVEEIIRALNVYDINFDEGMRLDGNEVGDYGPYKQSDREIIYKTYVKNLIERGLAYPCFCSEDELEGIRSIQQENKELPGYYGKWAKCRDMSLDEIKENLENGKKYVIRFRSPGNPDKKIMCRDLIKGNIEMPENIQDIVILKTDGLPTYHFAHAVDDHLMRTTHVIRADEWLPSLPLHIQLFNTLGFKVPKFAHISPLMKLDGNSKRKLSKRKDPEVSFIFYDEEGYPSICVIDYLLSIINSNYEDWRRNNPDKHYKEFKLELKRMSPSGAIFDVKKLDDVSKNMIFIFKQKTAYEMYLNWTKKYEKQMAELLKKDKDYAIKIFSIERGIKKPRKDFSKWKEVRQYIGYFYDDIYYMNDTDALIVKDIMEPQNTLQILEEYLKIYNPEDDNETWFNRIRDIAEKLGYAGDMKEYKKNPENFKGNVSDVAMVIRAAVTNRTATFDLYQIMKLLGKDRVIKRLQFAIENTKK